MLLAQFILPLTDLRRKLEIMPKSIFLNNTRVQPTCGLKVLSSNIELLFYTLDYVAEKFISNYVCFSTNKGNENGENLFN